MVTFGIVNSVATVGVEVYVSVSSLAEIYGVDVKVFFVQTMTT